MTLPDGFDDASGFHAGGEREVRLVQADAEVDVNEVHAADGNADQRLALAWHRDRNLFEQHLFGTARFTDENRFHACAFWLMHHAANASRYRRLKGKRTMRPMARTAPAPAKPRRNRTK